MMDTIKTLLKATGLHLISWHEVGSGVLVIEARDRILGTDPEGRLPHYRGTIGTYTVTVASSYVDEKNWLDQMFQIRSIMTVVKVECDNQEVTYSTHPKIVPGRWYSQPQLLNLHYEIQRSTNDRFGVSDVLERLYRTMKTAQV